MTLGGGCEKLAQMTLSQKIISLKMTLKNKNTSPMCHTERVSSAQTEVSISITHPSGRHIKPRAIGTRKNTANLALVQQLVVFLFLTI